MINQAVTDRLRAEGYDVVRPATGRARSRRSREHEPDLVLLDVMLPGFDGHEVCRRIQAERPVPVLMLTARDDEADILVGLGRRCRRLPDQAVPDAGAGGPGRAPCCAGSSRAAELADAAGRSTSATSAIDAGARRVWVRRRRGAPDADRVRPAALPGRRARARS